MSEPRADYCVIGSGAAGAVIACRLAEQGKRVVILESGRHVPSEEFTHDEIEMLTRLYKHGGLQMTTDFDMYIVQGRCVGGSTVITDAICFRMPEAVLPAWAALGAHIDPGKLANSYDAIERGIRVSPLDQSVASAGAHLFAAGAARLGDTTGWFRNNRVGCHGTGLCNLGCKYDRKQSALVTFIPWALERGARLVADCHADRVRWKKGRALGVECTLKGEQRYFVEADNIVVSCGAIASSALLLRSRIRQNTGTRLSFNAGSMVHGEFEDPVNAFDGISMCNYLDTDGILLETVFSPPGAYSLSMPGWFEEHQENMQRYAHFMRVGALIATKPDGRVRATLAGDEEIDYWMAPSDFERLKKAIKVAARVLLAAGARRVLTTTHETLEIRTEADLAVIDTRIVEREDVSIGSAHPQGGNPMSDDPAIGAVDSRFRVHGFENLFVCDASVFPTSIRVNPQLTVMAMADYASKLI